MQFLQDQPLSFVSAQPCIRGRRQGMGVTGGSPIGFDVGAPEEYGTLPGLDLVRHFQNPKSRKP